MPATNVETLTNPRDSLPNVYTNVTAREVDFVTRFGDNWEALRNILGIMRPIRKAPGTSLTSYSASVALESGNVGPGKVIPYSKATITQAAKADLFQFTPPRRGRQYYSPLNNQVRIIL